jgi:hypothetical protein
MSYQFIMPFRISKLESDSLVDEALLRGWKNDSKVLPHARLGDWDIFHFGELSSLEMSQLINELVRVGKTKKNLQII